MNIFYANKKVEKQCTELKQAKIDFPLKIAKKLLKLVNFIEAAENLNSVIGMKTYRFHKLKGDLSGLYAMDIDGVKSSYRLLVSFNNEGFDDVFTNSVSIEVITIEEVSKHYE